MDSAALVEELDKLNRTFLDRIGAGESENAPDVPALLQIALRNELEAAELAARWRPSTPELDVKLGLARQTGDEARHYRLLEARYRELGGLPDFDPRDGGPSPLLEYLSGLQTSVERLAAGQFTREAVAERRNALFLEYLERIGDSKTAALYRDQIQPDEAFHHDLGRRMLLKYAVTPELQQAARQASLRTLEIAEALRAKAAARAGCPIPGC